MRHNHRIVPGHMGGEYVEGNVISVSPLQHSMWHWANYFLYKKPEDKVAARALAGVIGKEELIKQACILGGKNAAAALNAHPNTKKNRSEIGKRVGKKTVKLMNSHPNTVEGRVRGGKNVKLEDRIRGGRKGGLIGGSKGGKIGGNRNTELQQSTRKNNANKLNSQKWVSLADGFMSTAAGVSHHNKSIGVDPELKRRVDGTENQRTR